MAQQLTHYRPRLASGIGDLLISRRNFLASSATIGILGNIRSAEAWIHGSAGAVSAQGKAQVNLQVVNGGAIEYPFINVATMSAGFAPTGGTPTADPYLYLNSDGYPTGIVPGTSTWRADTQDGYYVDAESFFTGTLSSNQITVTSAVTGKALFIGQTVSDAQNGSGTLIPAGTRITNVSGSTLTLSNSVTSGSSVTLYAFIPWVATWVGNVGMGLSAFSAPAVHTNLAVGIGSNRVEWNLAAQTISGATFTLNLSAGSHSATLTSIVGTLFQGMYISGQGVPEYTTLGSGSGGNWQIVFNGDQGQGLSYALTNVTCTGARITQGYPISFSAAVSAPLTTQLSNFQIFRQDQEALLGAGKITAPHMISNLQQYGRLRFLNYTKANGNMLANWADRPQMSNYSWYQQQGVFLQSKYAGLCPATTKGAYVGLNAAPGNPSSWVDKQTVQFTVTDCPAICNIIGFIDNGAGSGSPSGVAGNTLTVTSTVSGSLRIGLQLRPIGGNGNVNNCNITAGSGTSWTVDGSTQNISPGQMVAVAIITGMSNATSCVITSNNHSLTTGDVICIPYGEIIGGNFNGILCVTGGPTGILYTNDYAVTVLTSNTFSIPVDTSNTGIWGTYSSGGVFIYAPTFKTGLLPAKQITSISLAQLSVPQFAGLRYNGGNLFPALLITAVYDATLDVLMILWGGNGTENEFGVPFEACVQMAKEINGPDPWINVPAFFTDSAVNSLASYIKANLTDVTPLKWCFELSNEVWDTAIGFWQTPYAQGIAQTKWGVSVSNSVSQWFGWRWNAMIAQVNSVFGSNRFDGKVVRIFSFRADDSFPADRYNAPATGISGNNLDLATELCYADYTALGTQSGGSYASLPDAQTIYNYQQGIITNNNTLIQSALNAFDGMYNAPGCAWVSGPVTGFIDDGSGNGSPSGISGTILTVTNINPGGAFLFSHNPQLGQWTALTPFGGTFPAVNSVVDHQLSGTTGGLGRYQLKGFTPSQLLPGGSTFTVRGSNIWHDLNDFLANWATLATAHGITVSFYEGGTGDFPSANGIYTTYSGNPLNQQDLMNLYQGYYRSSQMQTTVANFLAATKAAGGTFSSQYAYALNTPTYAGGIYGMIPVNILQGTPFPFKTAFDAYNAS